MQTTRESQLSGENIKLSDIHMNVVRHSHECLETRMNENETLKLHLWERCETLSRIRPKFTDLCIKVQSMRLQCESCVYIVNLCRKIVASKSQTNLQGRT